MIFALALMLFYFVLGNAAKREKAVYLYELFNNELKNLGFVVEIDKSTKEENSAKTRSLGKMAKASFNKLYEYNTICQNYSNISSYLRGMIKNRGLK